MHRPWWVIALQWTLWIVIMSAVMGWMSRRRFRQRPLPDARKVAHPSSTLILGLVGVAFFGGITVISNTVGKNRTTTTWTTLGFLVFALGSLAMIAEYLFARHEVSAEGMDHRGMLGRRRQFAWSDVKRVRYNTTMKWFAIHLHSGPTVRVSTMLMGLPEFARQLLAHVPPGAIDEPSLEVLRETADGRPPSLWT